MRRYHPFINGKPVPTSQATVIRAPYDGSAIHEVSQCGEREVEDAIVAAAESFEKTRHLSRLERSEILARTARTIGERHEEFAQLLLQEAGKPIALARWEITRSINTFQLASEEAKRFTGELIPADILPPYRGYRVMYERFPVGPVLAITPFNFPQSLVAHKVAPALAAGNSVVLKPAPQTCAPAIELAQIIHAAGAPPGALNVISTSNELAERMVRDERFKLASFTGGAATGWHLKNIAGKKKTVLELGGNGALIIEADADIARAARKAALGAFSYAGQVCISVQRIFVNEAIHDHFMRAFLAETEQLGVGHPALEGTVVGPMISKAAADRVEQWVGEARSGGAKVVLGGKREGNLIWPTVLTDVERTMRVSCEEVFGPVVTVEPYRELPDAIRRANDSAYGLQAGLFTIDYRKIEFAFQNLEVGALMVNETSMLRIDNYPYGGVKDSGFGREGVRFAMESMSEPRVLLTAPA